MVERVEQRRKEQYTRNSTCCLTILHIKSYMYMPYGHIYNCVVHKICCNAPSSIVSDDCALIDCRLKDSIKLFIYAGEHRFTSSSG